MVNNVDTNEGKQAFVDRSKGDWSQSLANWIEVSRAEIELLPAETKRLPILIQINLRANPGIYHAEVAFAAGPSRDVAELKMRQGEGEKVVVNIEVLDDAKEVLQLGKFVSDKPIFSGGEASFTYELENVGNRTVSPKGTIRIYNRRGEEVGEIPVNENDTSIEPKAKDSLAAAWAAGAGMGRYKAYLDLEYGDQRANIQDTIQFWIIPWKKLLLIFSFVLVALIIGAILLHRRYIEPFDFSPEHQSFGFGKMHHEPTAVPARVSSKAPIPTRAPVYEPAVLASRPAHTPSHASHAVTISKRPRKEPPESHVINLRK